MHSTRPVVLRSVALRPVALTEVSLNPISVDVGPQALDNFDFSAMTVGAELITDPGFDTGTGWALQADWVISGGLATFTWNGANRNISTNDDPLTAYQSLVFGIDVDSNTFDGAVDLRNTVIGANQRIDNSGLGLTNYYKVNWGTAPLNISIRARSGTTGSFSMASVSVKPIDLDDWTEIGTRTATEYIVYNAEDSTVQIVSGGAQIGIDIAITDFIAGQYVYMIDVANDNSGSLKISTSGDGDLATINDAGVHDGVISITDSTIQLEANGACDLTVNSFKLFPVV